MTRSPLWREFESGDNIILRLIRFLILGGGFVFMVFSGVLELTWPQQAVMGLLLVLLAIWMDRSSTSYLVTLSLMLLSCFSTFRYGFWRISTVVKFFTDPGNRQVWTPLDAFFIWLLVFAEAYAFGILFLGYMQTLWPLRRTPVPLPEDTDLWPEVDLLIPTYNEPLNVVRYTALAAMNIDWPADKLNVYILDDGKREEFRAFAEEAGRSVCGDLRLGPRADEKLSAADDGLVRARCEVGDAADAAPFLFSRPVRAQSWTVSRNPERGRTVLRRRAGWQRLLECDVLLRIMRCDAAVGAR
jgi:hypothetical protein